MVLQTAGGHRAEDNNEYYYLYLNKDICFALEVNASVLRTLSEDE